MTKRNADNLIELIAGDRQEGETDKAVIACSDWLRLGAGRTLRELLSKYTKTHRNPPTKSLDTAKEWSTKFKWADRAASYDATWEERKNAERRAVFDQGLALDYERVRKLMNLAEFLEGQIYEQDADGNYPNLWVEDVKGIGSRDDFERVEIEHFNPALLEQYRRTLDDIAKETGGRKQKTEIEVPGGLSLRVDDMTSILSAIQQHKDAERGSSS